MGLDTSHNAWHGPYSSFHSFRKFLANRIGIVLDSLEGFGGTTSWDTFEHDIKPLLFHSDCDGELSPEECEQVARGLKSIIDATAETEENEYYIRKAKQFMEGCLDAASKKESIDFH